MEIKDIEPAIKVLKGKTSTLYHLLSTKHLVKLLQETNTPNKQTSVAPSFGLSVKERVSSSKLKASSARITCPSNVWSRPSTRLLKSLWTLFRSVFLCLLWNEIPCIIGIDFNL